MYVAIPRECITKVSGAIKNAFIITAQDKVGCKKIMKALGVNKDEYCMIPVYPYRLKEKDYYVN